MREETLYPADLDTARRGVHHQHDPRAEPGRADRRSGDRHGAPGPITLDLLARYRRYAWESTRAAERRTSDRVR